MSCISTCRWLHLVPFTFSGSKCNLKLQYHNQSINDNVELSYHYDVLTESKNKRYVKHEIKNHLQLVAVKITNLTGHDVNPMNDEVF
jgi:hypothetical protein